MNQYQRLNIARKTGTDPLKSYAKLASPQYELIHERSRQIIIKGLYKLCKWKMKEQQQLNPMSKYIIQLIK